MKISLVTVCLNSESTITDTISSVISQDYPQVEHIIFDGGSTDRTVENIKAFGSKVKLIRGSDTGIFDAMNQAISHATGDIVGIINSDDFYSGPEVLSLIIEEFEKAKTDTVYGDLHYVHRKQPEKIFRNWRSGSFNLHKFKWGWTLPHPTFFVKKEVYEKYGRFNEQFSISGDYELILRFLYKHKVSTAYIPEVMVKMRAGGNSDGGFSKRIKSLREDYLAWRINDLTPAFYTIPLKPLRKLKQLIG